jgi:hypothetical protein
MNVNIFEIRIKDNNWPNRMKCKFLYESRYGGVEQINSFDFERIEELISFLDVQLLLCDKLKIMLINEDPTSYVSSNAYKKLYRMLKSHSSKLECITLESPKKAFEEIYPCLKCNHYVRLPDANFCSSSGFCERLIPTFELQCSEFNDVPHNDFKKNWSVMNFVFTMKYGHPCYIIRNLIYNADNKLFFQMAVDTHDLPILHDDCYARSNTIKDIEKQFSDHLDLCRRCSALLVGSTFTEDKNFNYYTKHLLSTKGRGEIISSFEQIVLNITKIPAMSYLNYGWQPQ